MRIVCGLALLLAACSGSGPGASPNASTAGTSGAGPGPQDNGLPPDFISPECRAAGAQPGASPIRRLTRHEYDNTVVDLLANSSAPAQAFPDEEIGLGFTNNADVQTVSDLLVE